MSVWAYLEKPCDFDPFGQKYGKGDDPDRDPAWSPDGYERPVLRLVLLPVLIRLAYPAADYIQIPNEIAIGLNRC